MVHRARFLALLLALSGVALLSGCSGSEASSDDEPAAPSEDELRTDRGDHPWIYAGALPSLESPDVHISLDANTARISGLLPAGFDEATLPFYAKATADGARTRVTVVYPVATGRGTNAPGDYAGIRGVPFTPSKPGTAWGGFPFLAYNVGRGIAMHGPITSEDSQWHLIRGPVSHGCNRMQGEHVVEVAQLLGIDMRTPHTSGEVAQLKVAVSVVGYDPAKQNPGPPQWDRGVDGKYVDVDYPAQDAVRRPPAAETTLYPTWDSKDFPRIVCAYQKGMRLGPNACDAMPANTKDAKTGTTFAAR